MSIRSRLDGRRCAPSVIRRRTFDGKPFDRRGRGGWRLSIERGLTSNHGRQPFHHRAVGRDGLNLLENFFVQGRHSRLGILEQGFDGLAIVLDRPLDVAFFFVEFAV